MNSHGSAPGQHAHHRHAHGDAEGDLRQDHRLAAVGDRRVDLDAAVHRPRMHDDGVGLGQRQLFRRQAVGLEVFLRAGQQRALHALVLQAQHHDHVDALQAFAQVVEDAHARRPSARRRSAAGSSGRRRGSPARPAWSARGSGERATRECSTSPTMATVSCGEVALVVADGVHVEQALRRVGMAAVAGIDDVDVLARRWLPGAGRSGRARRCEAWRTTNMSACMAARLSTVSSRVSPLAVLEVLMLRLMTSAERRLAAISKVVRVRVEFSKNRLNTLLPRSSGTFFTSRSAISVKGCGAVEDAGEDLARQSLRG